MADEFYRLELVISTSGDEQTKRKLQAMDRFIEQTRRRGETLSRMQMSPAVRLTDRISEPLRRIDSKLRSIGSKAWAVTLTAKDKVTGTLSSIVKKITSPLAMLGAGAGMTAAIGFPLKLAGEMEQARMAMDFFTGSAEKGKKFLDELVAFAAKTPFEFPFIQESAVGLMGLYKQMMSVDKAMKETMRTITAFGNAAGYTGAGVEGMQMALLGFRQIGMIGTLQMEELRQVTENLRIPMSLVTKELGLSSDKLKDIGRAGIPASRAMEAIVRALEKEYAGGMDKLSRSLFGLTSTLRDTARLAVTAFGAGMAGPVKRILMDIVGSTDYTSDKFKAFQKKVEQAGRSIGEKFEGLYQNVKRFFSELTQEEAWKKADWAGKMSILLDRVIEIVVPKAGEVGVKVGVELAKGIISGFGKMISESPIVAALLGGLVGAKIGSIIPGAGTLAGALAGAAAGFGTWAIGKGIEKVTKPKPKPKYPGTTIGPAKAYGGIVNRPVIAGEAGPEAIIPLSPRLRSRALELWQETGKRLGIMRFQLGGFTDIAAATVGSPPATIQLNFDLSGLVRQIVVNSKEDLGKAADEIGAVIVRKLKAILENLPG